MDENYGLKNIKALLPNKAKFKEITTFDYYNESNLLSTETDKNTYSDNLYSTSLINFNSTLEHTTYSSIK